MMHRHHFEAVLHMLPGWHRLAGINKGFCTEHPVAVYSLLACMWCLLSFGAFCRHVLVQDLTVKAQSL